MSIGTGPVLCGVGETYRGVFPTYNSSGALTNADSTPTGTLVVNGSDTAVTVTVSNAATGRYNVSCSLSGRSVGDDARVRISATVGGVTQTDFLPGFRVAFASAIANGGIVQGDINNRVDVSKFNGATGPVTGLATAGSDYANNSSFNANLVTIEGSPPAGYITDAVTAGLSGVGIDSSWAGDVFDNAAAAASTSQQIQTDVGTLLNRLTAARADYLDNLNVGDVVASQADVNAINQSASRRVILQTLGDYERPESGSTVYTVEARTYSRDGVPMASTGSPTLAATGATSGSLAANLGAVTNPATGVYRWAYTVASNATTEPIRFDFSATVDSDTVTMSTQAQVLDLVGATWTTSDRAMLTAAYNKLPSKSYLAGTSNSDGNVQLDEATGGLSAAAQATVTASVPTAAANAAATWGAGTRTLTGFGTLVADVKASLIGLFRLLARKDAAAATDNAADLTLINANGGSGAGGFNNTTDSNEAIRDRGDTAWTGGGGGGGNASFVVSPLQATVVRNKVTERNIELHEAAAETFTWVLTDTAGEPVDVSGVNLRLTLWSDDGSRTVKNTVTSTDGGLTVGGDDNNNVTRTFSPTDDADVTGTYRYILWDDDAPEPLVKGQVTVKEAVRS